MTNVPTRSARRANRAPRARRLTVLWIAVAVAAVFVASIAFVGVGLYTDRPQFCATCHEMRPYYEAWATGNHRDTWCVDCHVGKSYPVRLAHKFSVLGEVVAHFRGNVTFPQATPPALADAQCTRCHATVTTAGASGFDHAAHERHGPCQACHAQTGHDVTTTVLKATGVFNGSVAPTTSTGAFAVPDQGSANLPGHVAIPCSRCHNLAATGCQRCHTPRHTKNRPGACTLCHQPGPAFVFTHPTSEDCNTCHTPSTNHFKPANGQLAPCTRCHTQPGKSWSFTHPSKSATCTDCHAVPAQHNPPAASASPCTRCHTQPGESWAFTHPGSSANCQSCHTPPAEHAANGFTGQCSLCHHKPGVTFTFTHPSAGEHSYTSRPCAKCHPNGYPEAYCTCHNRAP